MEGKGFTAWTATVHDVPECTLPVIPPGMHPDATYGEQCEDCPLSEVIIGTGFVFCSLDSMTKGLGHAREGLTSQPLFLFAPAPREKV